MHSTACPDFGEGRTLADQIARQLKVVDLGNGRVAATEVVKTAAGPVMVWLEEDARTSVRPGSPPDAVGPVGLPAWWVAEMGLEAALRTRGPGESGPTPAQALANAMHLLADNYGLQPYPGEDVRGAVYRLIEEARAIDPAHGTSVGGLPGVTGEVVDLIAEGVDWWNDVELKVVGDLRPDWMLGCEDVRESDWAVLRQDANAIERRKRQSWACRHDWGTDTKYGFIVVGDSRPNTLMEPFMVRESDWGVLAGDEADPRRLSWYGHKVWDTTKWTNRNNLVALQNWYDRHARTLESWKRAEASGSLGLGAKGQQVAKEQLAASNDPADMCRDKTLGECLALRAAEIVMSILKDPFAWLSIAATAAWQYYLPFGAWIPVVTYGVVKLYWTLLKLSQGKEL